MAGGVLEFYAQQSLITDPGPYASELDALPRRVDALVRVVQGCSSTRWPRRGAGCLLRSPQPRMQFVSDLLRYVFELTLPRRRRLSSEATIQRSVARRSEAIRGLLHRRCRYGRVNLKAIELILSPI
jgi:hypothetical protein